MSPFISRSFLLLAALSLPLHAAPPAETPFVTVNGVAVSKTLAEIYMLHGKAQKLDPKKLEQDVREEIIRRELMYQEAQRLGIDKQPEVAKNADAEKAKVLIQAEAARQTIILRAFVQEYLKKHPVTEAQLKADYDKNRARGGDTEYKVRHILLKTEDEAKATLAKLQKGASFAELAADSLDSGTKSAGGDLGWSSPARYVAPFAEALKTLKKGQLYEKPVKSEFGYHLIQVDDTRPLQVPAFAELRPLMQRQAEEAVLNKLVDELRKKAKIE